MLEPDYMGDGVYATADEYGGIWLTANHHLRAEATDEIYLEPQVLKALNRYCERMTAETQV
jgi:hypothetical protein